MPSDEVDAVDEATFLDRVNLYLYGQYGEGCDEYQREAIKKWRTIDNWGLTETTPNPYCEYPRLYRRFPKMPFASVSDSKQFDNDTTHSGSQRLSNCYAQ